MSCNSFRIANSAPINEEWNNLLKFFLIKYGNMEFQALFLFGGILMKVEVLVATMNQTDHSLIDKMNIKSNAIIANQCERNEVENFEHYGYHICYLSFAERGVGLNRNNALMRSDADICIIADDDMVYVDNYKDIVIKSFEENPKADVILFNLFESPVSRFVIKKRFNVNIFSYTKFGAVRIAFRRKSITKHGIFFNLSFGGGAEYSNGEDTLFLHDCLINKLKIVAVPYYIATLTEERDSTWFKGYTEKLFMDTGAGYSLLFRYTFRPRCLYFCIRRYNSYKNDRSFLNAYKLLLLGAKRFKSNSI